MVLGSNAVALKSRNGGRQAVCRRTQRDIVGVDSTARAMAVRAIASRVPGLARPVATVTSSVTSRHVIALALREGRVASPSRFRAIEVGRPAVRTRSPCRAASSGTVTESSQERRSSDSKEDGGWQVKMLYDGECPLCMREVGWCCRGMSARVGAAASLLIAPYPSAEEWFYGSNSDGENHGCACIVAVL